MSDPTLPPEQPEQPYVPPAVPGGDYGPPPPAPPPPPPPPAPPAYGAPAYGAAPPPPPGYGAPPPAGYGQGGQVSTGPFSVSEAFNWGWAKFQQNAGAIVVSSLIYFVILGVIELVAYLILGGILLSSASTLHVNQSTGQITGGAGTSFVALLLFAGLSVMVFTLIAALVQSAIIRGLLEIANGKKVQIGDFFKFEKVGAVLTAGLVVAVATAIGAFLCYIPALVVAFFTPFYLFFIIDKNLAPMDAIKASISLVNKNLASMLILFIGMIVAYIVGAIVCLVGLLVTLPVALLALTFGYRKFQNEPIAA